MDNLLINLRVVGSMAALISVNSIGGRIIPPIPALYAQQIDEKECSAFNQQVVSTEQETTQVTYSLVWERGSEARRFSRNHELRKPH